MGLAAATFGNDFRNGAARDAAVEETIKDCATDGAFLGARWERVLQEGFRIHLFFPKSDRSFIHEARETGSIQTQATENSYCNKKKAN